MSNRHEGTSHINGVSVQDKQKSPHTRGGLGKEGWSRLIELHNDEQEVTLKTPVPKPILEGQLWPYALAVTDKYVQETINDSDFEHREYLDRHDLKEAAALVEVSDPKRNLGDRIKKRVTLDHDTVMAHYLQLEIPRAFSVRDHILDELDGELTWDKRNKKWKTTGKEIIGYHDIHKTLPIYKTAELEPEDIKRLKDIFLIENQKRDIATTPPTALYDELCRQAQEEPEKVRSILEKRHPKKMDPWEDIFISTSLPKVLGEDLQEAYKEHFGIQPHVSVDSEGIHLSPSVEKPKLPKIGNPLVIKQL